MTVALIVPALWKACISVGPNFLKDSFGLKLAFDSLWCWKQHDHKWCWLANAESCCKGLEDFSKIIYHASLPLLSFLLNSLFSSPPTQKRLIIRCRVIHPPLTVHWIEQIQLRLWLLSLSEFPLNNNITMKPSEKSYHFFLKYDRRKLWDETHSWTLKKQPADIPLVLTLHKGNRN